MKHICSTVTTIFSCVNRFATGLGNNKTSQRMLIFYYVILLSLSFVQIASAYDAMPSNTRTEFQPNPHHGSSAKITETLVLYGKIDPHATGALKTSPLQPYSDHFVPADTISANLPIHMLPGRPINSRHELANILHVNMKMKRLWDEYQSIQMDTERVLRAGSTSSFPMVSKDHNTRDHRTIHERRILFTAQYNSLSRVLKRDTIMADFANRQGVTALSVYDERTKKGRADYSYTDSRLGDLPARSHSAGMGHSVGKQSDASLPWILIAAFKTIEYIRANKVEMAVYLTILLSFVTVFSILRRR